MLTNLHVVNTFYLSLIHYFHNQIKDRNIKSLILKYFITYIKSNSSLYITYKIYIKLSLVLIKYKNKYINTKWMEFISIHYLCLHSLTEIITVWTKWTDKININNGLKLPNNNLISSKYNNKMINNINYTYFTV